MNYFILHLRRLALFCIRLYQKTLSLDHSPLRALFPYGYCRFRPTCSEYAYQAVSRYGIIRGSWLGLLRILRCNPWNKGGEDPLI